jgi:WD40 repeat protein
VQRRHQGAIYQLAWAPDGSTLASAGNDGQVILWGHDLTPRQRLLQSDHATWSVAFSPDGRTVATGGGDKLVRLWDVKTGRPRQPPFLGHAGQVYGVAFSQDGTTLASAGEDATVRLWNLRTGHAHATLRGHGSQWVQTVAFTLTEGAAGTGPRQVLASASRDGTVRLWRAATEKEVQARPK